MTTPAERERELFTNESKSILAKSTDIAHGNKSPSVTPLHLFLVLLCGKDVDISRGDFASSSPPTLCWSAIEEQSIEPISIAKELKHRISPTDPTPEVARESETKTSNPDSKRSNFLQVLFKRPGASRSSVSLHQPVETRDKPPEVDEALAKVVKRAKDQRESMGDLYVAPYHLLLAVTEDQSVRGVLNHQNVKIDELLDIIREERPGKITNRHDNQFSYLAKFSTDLSALAREGKLDEIVGRDEEIRRVVQILCRRTKNSAILLGEPGVGKTTIAEGLAQRMARGEVPEQMKGTIYSLDLGALFAGAGKGEYEERVKGVIDNVMRSQQTESPAILFIDEIHLITAGRGSSGQSSGMDAANLLKPALARGQFRCIGATTLAEYREHIERDGALERRFAPVMVDEPTRDQAVTILRGIRGRYEAHHRVWIMDQAIVTAVTLAQRYLTARRLPDSAVDLIDEACAAARISQNMKPEAIESHRQKIIQAEAHIDSLERDAHPRDRTELENARNSLVKFKNELERLEKQHGSVRKWWDGISVQRNTIDEKRKALNDARNQGNTEQRVHKFLEDLGAAQKRLLDLENQGPVIDENLHEILGKHYSLFLVSPDIVTPESIAAIVERATKIPVQRLLVNDKTRLLDLEGALSKQVIGQPEAVKAVTVAIQLSRTGLRNPNRPIASLLFTGPSGTGKTLMAKALAQELFGQATSMVRIDGSEYHESHSVSRLIGSPPGYVGYDQGGQLTEYVRRNPFCIVLLDEIEKTCPEFLTLFLQVLDEGRLTDGQGRLVDFRNCVIIMTSNVGSDILSAERGEISTRTRERVMDAFKRHRFPPEFLNRIEDVVMFRTMSEPVMRQILDKQLEDVDQREGVKRFRLDLDRKAKNWLISRGISPVYGARPLARVIQKELLSPLSQRLLEETIHEGDTVLIRVNDDETGLYVKPNHTGPPPREAVGEKQQRDPVRRWFQ